MAFEAVDKVDSLSQKCKHFFEEMQAAASHGAAFLAAPHVCGLSRVFSDAHVAGKNNLISFRHLRMTELCEALAQDFRHFYFFDKLKRHRISYGVWDRKRVLIFHISTLYPASI